VAKRPPDVTQKEKEMDVIDKIVDFELATRHADKAEERKLMFLALSRLYFVEMTTEVLNEMRLDAPLFGKHFESFHQTLLTGETEKLRRELAADFAALFLGLSARPVAPYESVYTSDEKLLMQEAYSAVLEAYQAEGLHPSELKSVGFLPQDHISYEFEFMAALCQESATLFESGNTKQGIRSLKKQRSFLEEHILKWVPQMCDDVLKQAKTSFYQGVATLTKSFLEEEKEYLKATLS